MGLTVSHISKHKPITFPNLESLYLWSYSTLLLNYRHFPT